MRPSTYVIVAAVLLIVIPIPVLPPLVGTIIGILALLVGLFLRFLGV
ncbi:hypothetical protein [Natrarchaeobius chitinivorans]|nr:hypothetical protein [Natrarchaeobius chitinivorans]